MTESEPVVSYAEENEPNEVDPNEQLDQLGMFFLPYADLPQQSNALQHNNNDDVNSRPHVALSQPHKESSSSSTFTNPFLHEPRVVPDVIPYAYPQTETETETVAENTPAPYESYPNYPPLGNPPEQPNPEPEPVQPKEEEAKLDFDPYHWRPLKEPPKPEPDQPSGTEYTNTEQAQLEQNDNMNVEPSLQNTPGPIYYKEFSSANNYEPATTTKAPETPTTTKAPPQPSYGQQAYYRPQESSTTPEEANEISQTRNNVYEFGFTEGQFRIPDFFRDFLSAPPSWIRLSGANGENGGDYWRRR